MKTKKIYNVDRSVCTGEQKVAYNYAFSLKDVYENYSNFESCCEIAKSGIENNDNLKSFNKELIYKCFVDNFKKYCKVNKSGILTSYEEIGNIFKLEIEL